jgi:hypothetical protein
LIQAERLQDSIIAQQALADDFFNSIPPKADIRQRDCHVRFVPILLKKSKVQSR